MSVPELQKLTPRQKEILRLLFGGFETKSIASELGISVHTVTEHLREARRHLGVSSSREAARMLAQAEAGPPNNMGPSNIGVAVPTAAANSLVPSSKYRRLAYLGVSIMILFAIASIALTLSNTGMRLQQSDTAAESVSATAADADPSPYPVRDVPVARFEQVKVSGAFMVTVFASDEENRVRLQGPLAMIDDVIATVEDGTLTLSYPEGAERSWNPGAGVNIAVWTPTLASIDVDGPSRVEIIGPQGDSFSATTQAAGSIEVTRLDVGEVRLATNGAGGISADGMAREATYSVGGAGSIDAMRLRTTNARIAIGGAGSNYANVSGEARILLSRRRGGKVEVVGGGTCVTQPADSDRVACR